MRFRMNFNIKKMQNLELVNLEYVTYAQPIPLSVKNGERHGGITVGTD